MKSLDLLSFPFIEITDEIVLSDKRILILYLYKLLTKHTNVSYHSDRLWVDGCSCILRSNGKKINFHPSYQKGCGRTEDDNGFENLKKDIDFFIIVKIVKDGVVLIPISSNDVLNPKSSLEDLCLS